jgi:predicted esterase
VGLLAARRGPHRAAGRARELGAPLRASGLLLLAAGALAGAPETPHGLIERIACEGHADQSYAVYLPASYAPPAPSPAIYLLDARGRAILPIERFRDASERFGWILISSYNSRSDTSDDPNTPALTAMWNDSHTRLAIDERRTYLGGFSGGGRAAVSLAQRLEGRVAGVIGCGAGVPDSNPSRSGLAFPYFGTVGDRDFNYYEMRALDERLAAAGSPHRIATFTGRHDWPPAELAAESLAWMELQAFRTRARADDREALASLYRADVEGAEGLESAGRRLDAARRRAEIAADYRGLVDVSAAESRAAADRNDASLQKALRDDRRRDARDRDTLETLAGKVNRAASEDPIPPVARVSAELQIPALRHRAAQGPPEERLSAERLLANLRVQTGFYLPQRFMDAGDFRRAVLMLSLAAEIDPDAPSVYYDRAAAHARAGEPGPALADLQRAVDRGFRRFDALEADPDFARLRETPAFHKWLTDARARV